jgi:hypothetical protein
MSVALLMCLTVCLIIINKQEHLKGDVCVIVPHIMVFLSGVISVIANVYAGKVGFSGLASLDKVNFSYLYLYMVAFLTQNFIMGLIMLGALTKAK